MIGEKRRAMIEVTVRMVETLCSPEYSTRKNVMVGTVLM